MARGGFGKHGHKHGGKLSARNTFPLAEGCRPSGNLRVAILVTETRFPAAAASDSCRLATWSIAGRLIPDNPYWKLGSPTQCPSSFTGFRRALHVKHGNGAHILLPLSQGTAQRSANHHRHACFFCQKTAPAGWDRVAGVLTDETTDQRLSAAWTVKDALSFSIPRPPPASFVAQLRCGKFLRVPSRHAIAIVLGSAHLLVCWHILTPNPWSTFSTLPPNLSFLCAAITLSEVCPPASYR